MNTKKSGYTITHDPSFQDEMFDVTPQLKTQFSSLFEQSIDSENKTIIDELIQLVIKHPNTPQLKNYLSGAYFAQHNLEKANEVTNWILKEHPNYLYSILNKVEQHLKNKEYREAEILLGHDLEIKGLYPDRNIFHATEVLSYYGTVIRYLIATDDLDLAVKRFEIMSEIAPNDTATQYAKVQLDKAINEILPDSWFENQMKDVLEPIVVKKLSKQKYQTPKFNHKEIVSLYEYELDLPHEILNEILNLPRKTLIEDLETIIADAQINFHFYFERDFDFDNDAFLLHALFILRELKSYESLPKILELFENDEDLLEFYFNEYLMEQIWMVFYDLGKNQLDLILEFLLKPGINPQAKIAVLSAIEQIGYYEENRIQLLFPFYEKLIKVFLNAKSSDNLIDSDFIAFVILDAVNFGYVDLLPEIKELYKKKRVSLFMTGNYKEAIKEINQGLNQYQKKEMMSVLEIYSEENYFFDQDDDEFYDEEDDFENDFEEIKDEPKVIQLNKNLFPKAGRNEPCPCGSGKKYKKCCL